MPDAAARRRRDPEARKRAIVAAATELILEVGVEALTHRMIASRAEVPLGATTQYFATLDDLRAAALRHLVSEVDARIDGIRAVLAARGATPAVLTELILRGLADARTMAADRAVVTAAIDDPELRRLARSWSNRMVDVLSAEHGAERAVAAGVFIDGILWHARIHDEPLPASVIESALTRILAAPTP